MEGVLKLKRVVIKEEIFAITQDTFEAIILGQLIYWQEKVNDFDKYIDEEKKRGNNNGIEVVISPTNGWMYKKASELIEECMLTISENTARKYLKNLEGKGFISSRTNPLYKWDKVLQYRVNMMFVIGSIKNRGFDGLGGYKSAIEKNETSKLKFRASNLENGDSDLENYGAIPEITNRDYYIDKDNIVAEAPSKKSTSKFDFKKGLIELGVEDSVADDWIELRKKKKASNSQTSLNAIGHEIKKSGRGANECIVEAVMRGWQGFKADWIKNKDNENSRGNEKEKRQREFAEHIATRMASPNFGKPDKSGPDALPF